MRKVNTLCEKCEFTIKWMKRNINIDVIERIFIWLMVEVEIGFVRI